MGMNTSQVPQSEYDARRGNIEYSDGVIPACTDDILISGHEPRRRHGMIVSGQRLDVLPFILRIPYLDEQIRRTRY